MRLIDADEFDRVLDDGELKARKSRKYVCEGVINTIRGNLANMPTIIPEGKAEWIPCSETVDIPDHEIIACDAHGELIIGYLEYKDEQWICESDAEMMYDPIAWMPLPEPYEEDTNGKT